jgi:hypothetical protein
MKANELRIGNYIGDKDDIAIVESIDKDGCMVQFINDEKNGFRISQPIKPIPLTEEWLLRMGFEKKEDDLFIIKLTYNNNSIKYSKDYQTWVYYKDDNDAGCNAIADCQYVHELQNLYFALTKKELTMK